MSKKDHIEEAFKEGFKNFEAPVDPSVWAGVQAGMSGGAGAAAGGMSIAKMIVIGVSAVAAVSVGVALYMSNIDDSTSQDKGKAQQQIVDKTPKQEVEPSEDIAEEKDQISTSAGSEIDKPTLTKEEDKTKNTAQNSATTATGNSNMAHNYAATPNIPAGNNNSNVPEGGNQAPNSNNSNNANNAANNNANQANKQDDDFQEELSLVAEISEKEGDAPLMVKLFADSNGDVQWVLKDEQGNEKALSGLRHEIELDKPGSYFITCTSTLGSSSEYKEFAVNVKSNFVCSIDESLLDFEGGIVLTPNGFDKKELRFNCSNKDEIEVFSMVVMNGRTQEKVFETHRVEDMNWGGKDASGSLLDKGTYFVIIFIGTKDGETIDPIKKRLIIR